MATFNLPEQGHLRLQLDEDQAPPLLWLSGDGRLWRQEPWTPGTQSHEWFHVKDKPSPLLARLEAEVAFSGRLLVATQDHVDSPDPFREVTLSPRLERVALGDADGERLPVHRLAQGEILEMAIEGPRVLALASRPAEGAEHQGRYSLSWTLDDAPWQLLTINRTRFSTLYQELGASRLHGGMDRRYLTIPEGEHRLRLKASLPLLARIEKADKAYFLDLNDPQPGLVERTQWLLDTPPGAGGKPLVELDALRQSNHIEGAADIALGFLEQGVLEADSPSWPGARPHPARQALAGNIERDQRFFRNLFPDRDSEPLALETAWFATTSPLELEADERYFLDADDVLDRLGRGLFVELAETPLTYPLPERFGPSRLRLSVARLTPEAEAALWVQYDDAPAQRLRLSAPALHADLSTPEDAILSQEALAVIPTLGGAFAAQREADHYWPTDMATLPLPADVGEVRVWGDVALPVSLQYRASQPYDAGETAYRELLEEVPYRSLVARLHSAFGGAPNPDSSPLEPVIPPVRALENQWYPMLRYLHASQAAYLDDFTPQGPAQAPADLEQRLARSRTQAQRSDWLGVLDTLGNAGYGHHPDAYRLSQQALGALGEHYLAGRQRQAVAVFGSAAGTRQLATQDLLTAYAETQRWESQVRLLAARFLREGDGQLLEPLGEALHRAGESLWATQLGLLLARERAPPSWLPEAAQEAGWSHTADTQDFERPARERALRQGDLAARSGDFEKAIDHWRLAGDAGAERTRRMYDAQAIASELGSRDRKQRLAAVERWLAWSLSTQQAFEWASLGHRIESSRGFSTLFSEVTQRPLSLPHATADSPLELEVVGPAILRVQLRRVAPESRKPGEIDWLSTELVDVAGRTTTLRAPILSRAENPYLATINRRTATATGDDILLEVPPGLHRLRLRPRHHDYLAQLWQWQPTHSWAVLPPLTPLVLKDLLQGPVNATGWLSDTSPDYLRVHEAELELLPVLPSQRLHSLDLVSLNATAIKDALESLEFPVMAVAPEAWPEGGQAIRVESVETEVAGVPESHGEAYALAVALLWELEQNPDLMDRVSARLARLAQVHAEVVALRQLADRLLQGYGWRHISSSFESAGVRQLPLQEAMHSPFRRARQSLLPVFPASSMRLSGRGVEGVELSTPDPLVIEVRLIQRVLPHEARIPAEVMIQLGDRSPRLIRLSEEESLERIRLDPGEHALRLWLKEPRQQQFVTARLTLAGSGAPLIEDETRT
ncbi:MAG: hypothetical protein IBX53_14060, partial [Halomonas sp.]|nr:hypothetical protein [Halomonas sp.]